MELHVEHSLKKMCVFLPAGWAASDSVSLPRLNTPGGCPASHRQWADFLVSLMAPLHRQYKTARTETRWHLLLKIRQMPIQTSASRGYVLFISGNKRHTKVLKLSAGLRTHPAECSKLGKTRIIKDAGRGVVRNTGFCGQNAADGYSWNFIHMHYPKKFSLVQPRDCLLLKIHTHFV